LDSYVNLSDWIWSLEKHSSLISAAGRLQKTCRSSRQAATQILAIK